MNEQRANRLAASAGISVAKAREIIRDTTRLVREGKILPSDSHNQDRFAAAAKSQMPGPRENPIGYQIEKAALEAGDKLQTLEDVGRTIPAARIGAREALILIAKLALEAAQDLK